MNKKEQISCQKIYEENHKRITWFLWKHYSWLKEDDLHDVMQEIWKELCKHIGKVSKRSEAGQWAWLVTVANSKVVSFIRQNARSEGLTEKAQVYCTKLPENNPVQERVICKMEAESVMEKLSCEERKTLFGDFLNPEEPDDPLVPKKRGNASACKTYRARKKLLKHMKEGDWDA